MIQTTLIGHASLLIQSGEVTVVTDPVWFDTLYEDINVMCPSLILNKEKIPPIDILYISHRHQDHLDVRTLAYLVNNNHILKPETITLVPNDSIVLEVLRELEFKNIRTILTKANLINSLDRITLLYE